MILSVAIKKHPYRFISLCFNRVFFQFEALSSGLDLEFDADIIPTSPEPSMYETIYLTAHKAPCRAAAFNTDGSFSSLCLDYSLHLGTLVATGSADCSIKIMDVERMVQKEGRGEQTEGPDSQHPVIRTLYDHIDVIFPSLKLL